MVRPKAVRQTHLTAATKAEQHMVMAGDSLLRIPRFTGEMHDDSEFDSRHKRSFCLKNYDQIIVKRYYLY